MTHKKSGNKNGPVADNEKSHEQIMGKDKKSPNKKDFDKDFIKRQANVNSQSQQGHVRGTAKLAAADKPGVDKFGRQRLVEMKD